MVFGAGIRECPVCGDLNAVVVVRRSIRNIRNLFQGALLHVGIRLIFQDVRL
ncbi:hypothetical protein SAMN05192544_103041 [Paraburkholderia hospita]|nr:hypothetical protein SAMN05192544_103041 [Paraburkholderia hospita]